MYMLRLHEAQYVLILVGGTNQTEIKYSSILLKAVPKCWHESIAEKG